MTCVSALRCRYPTVGLLLWPEMYCSHSRRARTTRTEQFLDPSAQLVSDWGYDDVGGDKIITFVGFESGHLDLVTRRLLSPRPKI
jgi:hypothetical protein